MEQEEDRDVETVEAEVELEDPVTTTNQQQIRRNSSVRQQI